MKYRSDIDGLRALAVIPVVLFHAGVAQISGGFVGVDVFFVISGYLITGLILGDLAKDRFSIVTFYERRARRILPALFVVLFVATVATLVLLMPDRARDFGQSLMATVFFSSNIVFWKQSGYFQAPEIKPLLHTWSLAVEEQFYILYPLFLLLVHRFLRKRYVLALLPVFVVSLASCILGVSTHQSMTFFLAPARAWELILGGFLALSVVPPLRRRGWADLFGLLGLGLLAFSYLTLSGALPFPGVRALYPTLGAALIIYSGSTEGTRVAKVLSFKPVVFIGLISYSLYLWHWIVVVFLKSYLLRPLAGWEIAFEIALCIALASLSWKFVESPFRGRKGHEWISRRWIFSGAVAGSAILALVGGILFVRHGIPSRFSPAVLEVYAGKDDVWKRHAACERRVCQVGPTEPIDGQPSFLLWGDSHASAAAPVFEQLATANHVPGYIAVHAACAPLLGLRRYDQDNTRQCTQFQETVLGLIEAKHIRTVFLHGRWGLYAEGYRYKREDGIPALLTPSRNPADNNSEFEKLFRATIQELQRRHINVVVIASVPEVGLDVPTVLARSIVHPFNVQLEPKYSDFMERQARAFQVLSAIGKEFSVPVVYPHQALCDDALCSVIAGKHTLYVDDNHLSTHGAMLLAPVINRYLGNGISGSVAAQLAGNR